MKIICVKVTKHKAHGDYWMAGATNNVSEALFINGNSID